MILKFRYPGPINDIREFVVIKPGVNPRILLIEHG